MNRVFDPDRLAAWWVPRLIRHRRRILTAAAALAACGAVFSARLYAHLHSEVEELLPSSAPSVVAAHTIGPLVFNVTHLSVILEGGDPDAMERFADDLAARLHRLPPSLISSIDYKSSQQEAFLRHSGALYIDLPDLKKLSQEVDQRIAWERRQAAARAIDLLGDGSPAGAPPPIALNGLDRMKDVTGALSRFRHGYYQTPDGRILAMLIHPSEEVTGYTANKALVDRVKAEVRSLDPSAYDRHLRVGYDGEVESLVEEQASLIRDLASTTAVVLILELLVLWIYFRSWRSILAIGSALFAATALTFGTGWFLVGHLNTNTAFLGSIILGNGINASIIFAARYLEERRGQREIAVALRRAWSGTLVATFVASFGAGLAYASLASTSFRGFSQFGLLGGLGMAFCWLSAYLLLPPLVVALERPGGQPPSPHRARVGAVAAELLLHRRRPVQAATAALLVLSAIGLATYRGNVVEYDLGKLRSRHSLQSGAGYWGSQVDQVFKAYLTPIVVRADSAPALQAFLQALSARRAPLGSADPIRDVRTLASVIPADQQAKIPIIQRLRDELTPSRLKQLDPEVRDQVERFLPSGAVEEVHLEDLPFNIRAPLVERDGTTGKIALIFPSHVGSLQPRDLEELTRLIRGAISDVGGSAKAVGPSLLFSDISHAIITQGPRATLLAFALVCALVVIGLRRWRSIVAVLGSLCLGVLWLVGLSALGRARLNFLNFVVLPITFGIGVDYSVNIVQRVQRDGVASLPTALRETGGAVALCSLTTIIGYSSLILADNQALHSFGVLASLGEVCCLTAALVTLPAWLARSPRRAETRWPPSTPQQLLNDGRDFVG